MILGVVPDVREPPSTKNSPDKKCTLRFCFQVVWRFFLSYFSVTSCDTMYVRPMYSFGVFSENSCNLVSHDLAEVFHLDCVLAKATCSLIFQFFVFQISR